MQSHARTYTRTHKTLDYNGYNNLNLRLALAPEIKIEIDRQQVACGLAHSLATAGRWLSSATDEQANKLCPGSLTAN